MSYLRFLVAIVALTSAANAQIVGPNSMGVADRPSWLLPYTVPGGTTPYSPAQRGAWVLNVLDYGATKDDTGDNAAVFRNVMALASAGPIHVMYIPAGTYRVDMSSLNAVGLMSNVTMLGDGAGQTIIDCDDSVVGADACFINRTNGSFAFINSLVNFHVKGITFQGRAGDGTSPFFTAGSLFAIGAVPNGNQLTCSNVSFEDSEMTQGRGWGLTVKSCERVLIKNSNFYKIPFGGTNVWDSQDVLFDGNRYRYSADTPISCQISDHGQGHGEAPQGSGCTVVNNRLTETAGILLIGARNMAVSNNVMRRTHDIATAVESLQPEDGCCVNSAVFSDTVTGNSITDSFVSPVPSCGGCTQYNQNEGYLLVGGSYKQALVKSFGAPGSVGLDYNARLSLATNNPGGLGFSVTGNALVRTLPPHVLQLVTNGTTSSGNNVLNFAATALYGGPFLSNGMAVYGTNIPDGTTVSSFNSTTVTLSNNVTGGGVSSSATIGFTNRFNLTTAGGPTLISTNTLHFVATTAALANNAVVPGNKVYGTSIPGGTTVTSVNTSLDSGTYHLNVVLSANVTAQINDGSTISFAAVGQYSDWGYDPLGLWTCWHSGGLVQCGYDQAPVVESHLEADGVIINGPLANSVIGSNIISGSGHGILFFNAGYSANSLDFDGLVIESNRISDCIIMSCIYYAYGAQYQRITIRNNEIDGDPRFASTAHNANGTWTLPPNTPYAINLQGMLGATITGNSIRNVTNLIQGIATQEYVRDNLVYGVPVAIGCSGSNIGVACMPEDGLQWHVIHEDSNSGSGTYGQMLSNNSPTSDAQPSTGTWNRGAFVANGNPSVCGGANPYLGWQRLTTGSGNVNGTDWQPVSNCNP